MIYFMGVPVGWLSGHTEIRWPPVRDVWPRDPIVPTPWSGSGTALLDWHPERDGERAPGRPYHQRPKCDEAMIAAWDRSADSRRGCTATFAILGELGPDDALAMARRTYPALFARIEKHLGRPVEVRRWR